MPNAWAQNWLPALGGIGEDISGGLSKKWDKEEFQRLLGEALNSQNQQPVNTDIGRMPFVGQSLPQGGTYNYEDRQQPTGQPRSNFGFNEENQVTQTTPRQDIFDPSNYSNLMNMLKTNPQVFSGLMQAEQFNTPKTQYINQEGGGLQSITSQRGRPDAFKQVVPSAVKPPPPQYANTIAEAYAMSRDPRQTPEVRAAALDTYTQLKSDQGEQAKNNARLKIEVGGALGTGTGSGKMSVMINGKPTEGVYTVNKVTNQVEFSPVGESVPTAARERTTEAGRKARQTAGVLLNDLNEFEKLYKENNYQGRNWVGGVVNSITNWKPGAIGGAIKEQTGKIETPEQKLRTLGAQTFGEAGFARAGAAFTQNELNILKGYVPNMTMAPAQIEAAIPIFRDILKAAANIKERGEEVSLMSLEAEKANLGGGDSGTIKVRRKDNGKVGSLPSKNFDPSKYEKVE